MEEENVNVQQKRRTMEKYNLKIGDWVTYTAESGEKKTGKVSAIRERNMINVEGQFWPFASESLEPIPLTEEIVKKNEWIWKELLGIRNEGTNQSPRLADWFVSISNGGWSIEVRLIHFVHELQHIIWALGMDDRLKL